MEPHDLTGEPFEKVLQHRHTSRPVRFHLFHSGSVSFFKSHPATPCTSATILPMILPLLLLFFSSLPSSQSSFLCDFISSTNISEIHEFNGWECRDNEPIVDVCKWSFVKCSSGKVSRIDLSYRNISGTIPDSIQELKSSLRNLYLDDNHLFGTLPASLGQLTNLKSLQLSGNHLHGAIPDLSSLTKLTSLYLNHNSFTGSLPSSPTRLNKLLYLSLNHNNFTGAIPAEYVDLVRGSLVALDLATNQLTGEIPMDFCQTDTIVYSFHNDGLNDRCRGECQEKGCNRQPILHDFSEGLVKKTDTEQ